MNTLENIEDFYKNKFKELPKDLKNDIGHFNVFHRENPKNKTMRYSRRDYFKITLLKGKLRIHYADKSVESEKYALLFSDPLVPYSWEPLETEQSGAFCIFTEAFFYQFGALREYPVFKPNHTKVFILNEKNVDDIEAIYAKMFEEINSEYAYKYDALRNLVFELIHYAMKLEPSLTQEIQDKNKPEKIAALFTELLERQFPVEAPYQRINLRSPSDFATYLNIHTNHLNRTLKNIVGKTTSEIIAQRIVQEALVLLKHTSWSIADISFSLGFSEPPHFINFFKKQLNQSPQKFRNKASV